MKDTWGEMPSQTEVMAVGGGGASWWAEWECEQNLHTYNIGPGGHHLPPTTWVQDETWTGKKDPLSEFTKNGSNIVMMSMVGQKSLRIYLEKKKGGGVFWIYLVFKGI